MAAMLGLIALFLIIYLPLYALVNLMDDDDILRAAGVVVAASALGRCDVGELD